MGQKVHPNGIRLGVIRDWNARWYAQPKDYAKMLSQDVAIREYIAANFKDGYVGRVEIERYTAEKVIVIIFTSRPGTFIGRKGEGVERIRLGLCKTLGMPEKGGGMLAKIEEIKKPDLDARLVGEGICQQLAKRMAFRRVMKRAIDNTMKAGAEGVKVMISGRLNGAEIARSEWDRKGRVPLHTLRADVDYAVCEANTIYGIIGVKVWVFKGELARSKGFESV